MYSRLQYDVYQLLCLQQARRRCCSHGTSSREIVPYKGMFLIKVLEIRIRIHTHTHIIYYVYTIRVCAFYSMK